MAAGGIVLRPEQPPLIAVVRLRKRNEWVLPKGKLDDGETARAAAEREVLEETGHDVFVHEFLGTLVYESGGRSKVVHYWRMEAGCEPAHELMDDVRAVDWLPLEAAVERLSRGYERAFLENVGPIALEAAEQAGNARRSRTKQVVSERRRTRRVVATPPPVSAPLPDSPQPDPFPVPVAQEDRAIVVSEVVEAEPPISEPPVPVTPVPEPHGPEMPCAIAPPPQSEIEPAVHDPALTVTRTPRRMSLVQKMRDWLRRAA
jgi:8-oxo-dGTP diphosphatase